MNRRPETNWPLRGPDYLVGKETLDKMHEAAVTMIERTGISIEHAGVREAIAERDG
jgi:hypothetical protein